MIKNILANWSHVFISIIAVFILYPFFLETLGEEQYGVWLLISSATGYFSLLQMGVPMANVRFISKYYANQDYEKLNEVVCTNLFFFTIGALLIMVFGTGLSYLLDVFFKIPAEFVRLAKIATLIVCFEISMRFVFEVFEGFFHAKQQFVAFNLIKNILIVLRVLVTFAIIKYDDGLVWVALVLLFITVIQSLLFFIYIRISNPFLRLHYKYIKKDTFVEIFGYSVFVLLFQLASKISFNTDTLVIGSVVSVSAVVWFSIGNNLLIYFMKFMSGISTALMPKISTLEAKGKLADIKSIYCQYSRFIMFLVLPVCLSFWCFGGDFIALWMGEKYRAMSGNVLSILSIGYLFYLVQSGVAFPILMGTSRVKYPTILMFGTALLNLILSIFLGKYYGIYGVAWGTTIPLMIVVVAVIIYMCQVYNVRLSYYLFHSVVLPFIGIVPFLGVYAVIVVNNIHVDTYFVLTLCTAACMSMYLITIYFLLLTKREKEWLFRKINK